MSRRLKRAKSNPSPPSALESADCTPNHAIRIVANPRNRFWPCHKEAKIRGHQILNDLLDGGERILNRSEHCISPLYLPESCLQPCGRRTRETHKVVEALLPIDLCVDAANAGCAAALGVTSCCFSRLASSLFVSCMVRTSRTLAGT